MTVLSKAIYRLECSNPYQTTNCIFHRTRITIKNLKICKETQKTLNNVSNRQRIRDQVPASTGSSKKQENSRKTSISALLTMPKPLTVWVANKLWKILKEMEMPDCLTCHLRNLYAGQEATIELDMEQETGSKYKKSLSRLYIVILLI